ncbi:unnamed protein product [Cylindrotheca closterium]|uniref:Peptidase M16C associated domain-containing protein n=1 Tax=Cylindrotheca closterium TaxID=2856 RepID=A0AAD2JPJ2_9STRA|nr:unnamed protein product [Cylindrotheca closterium]
MPDDRKKMLKTGVLLMVAVILGVAVFSYASVASAGGQDGPHAVVGSVESARTNINMSTVAQVPDNLTQDASFGGGDGAQAVVGHPSFAEVTDRGNIEPAQANIKMLSHTKSGMPIMTMVPDDLTQDATFGVSFRTRISDNRGMATITEHSVQAGSKAYPVRDPINRLRAGSLQTHLETWSDLDRTSFTMASRNLKDFKNSMAVMLDGIFHPLLGDVHYEWIYRQEGWRLETNEDQTNLYISGNAYNRARAAQMFPDVVLDHFVYSRLFKGHTYGYNPKGLWNETLSGARDHMIKFYNSWYQPSNGRVFCYGAPEYINACLDAVDEAVTRMLNDQAKKLEENGGISILEELGVSLPEDSKVDFKKLNSINSVEERVPYPSYDRRERRGDFRLSISWVLNDKPMDRRTEVAWYLIWEILAGPSGFLSPDPMSQIDTNLQQWVMTIGVSGLPTEAAAGEARTNITNMLGELSQNGFDHEVMAIGLNEVEFMLRDMNTPDGSPLGVHMFKTVMRKWNYDLDPTLALTQMDEFKSLRAQLEDPDNLEGMEFILELMTKGLSNNTAQAIATLYPSKELRINAENNEYKWLRLHESDEDWYKANRTEFIRQTAEFHRVEQQGESEMDIATIPRLSPKDVPKKAFEIPTKVTEGVFDSDLTMIENIVPDSNNITYVDFTIDISVMPFKDVILLPLICRLLVFAGTEHKSDWEIQDQIDLYTGGLTIEPLVEEVYEFQEDYGYKVASGKHMITKLLVRTSCLAEKGCGEAFNLIKTVIYDSVIDEREKIIDILHSIVEDMEDDVQRNGNAYLFQSIQSRYTLPGFIREQWFGITQLYKARALLKDGANYSRWWEKFFTRLLIAHDAIKRTHHSGLLLSITGDEKAIKDIGDAVRTFVKDTLPPAAQRTPFPDFAKVEHPWVVNGNLTMNKRYAQNLAFLIPTLANDVAMGGLLFQPGEHISGAHMAAVQYLGGFFLNEKIRSNLGASQAWAQLDMDSGALIYYSETTPSMISTFKIFRDAAGWVQQQMDGHKSLAVEAQAAIIGTVGKIDGSALQPDDVSHVALLQFLKQDTKEGRKKLREEALQATKEDFIFVANRLASWGGESIYVMTNEGSLDQFNSITSGSITPCTLVGPSSTYCSNYHQ